MKHTGYFKYIEDHRSAVKQVWFKQLRPHLERWGQDKSQLDCIDNLIRRHDQSKFSPEEFDAYNQYFFEGNRSDHAKRELDMAWLHHQNNNLHHWQYWVLITDDELDPIRPLNMPFEYICEMVCDWHSFSIKDPSDTASRYYAKHGNDMILSQYTRSTVEELLKYLEESGDK